MGADQFDVDPAGDQWFQRRIVGRLGEAVEAPVLQVRDARRELEAQQACRGRRRGRNRRRRRCGGARIDLALVIEQRVQHMQRLARRRRDQLGEVRPVTVREVRVDLEARPLAVMGIEPAGVTAEAGGLEELAVGRGRGAVAEQWPRMARAAAG